MILFKKAFKTFSLHLILVKVVNIEFPNCSGLQSVLANLFESVIGAAMGAAGLERNGRGRNHYVWAKGRLSVQDRLVLLWELLYRTFAT